MSFVSGTMFMLPLGKLVSVTVHSNSNWGQGTMFRLPLGKLVSVTVRSNSRLGSRYNVHAPSGQACECDST